MNKYECLNVINLRQYITNECNLIYRVLMYYFKSLSLKVNRGM